VEDRGAFFAALLAPETLEAAALIAEWTSLRQEMGLEQEMFVGAVHRLIALGLRIPADAYRQHMRVANALPSEVKLQAFLLVCSIADASRKSIRAGTARGSRAHFSKCSSDRRISVHLPSGVFDNHRARDDGARNRVLRGFGTTLAAKTCCLTGFRQIA